MVEDNDELNITDDIPLDEDDEEELTPPSVEKDEEETFESDVDYDTVLDDFEGPLDLLLLFIKKAKIRIEDVFVSKVTEQFLDYIEYMKKQPSRNVDKECMYLAYAAQIIYLKSKSLVPAIEYSDEDYIPLDEEELEFIEKLKHREYELIQQETPKLKEMETYGYYYKGIEEEFAKTKVVYKDFTVDGLLQAFANLMLKREGMLHDQENNYKEIPKDIYTVPEKIQFIKNRIIDEKEIKFDSLFDSFSKGEVITTLQALLEMLKFQYITVEQSKAFDEITIKLNPNWDLKDVSDYEFEEYD